MYVGEQAMIKGKVQFFFGMLAESNANCCSVKDNLVIDIKKAETFLVPWIIVTWAPGISYLVIKKYYIDCYVFKQLQVIVRRTDHNLIVAFLLYERVFKLLIIFISQKAYSNFSICQYLETSFKFIHLSFAIDKIWFLYLFCKRKLQNCCSVSD